MAFAVTGNLGVAHFRDGLEAGTPWRLAAEQAVPALIARPVDLASIESWILALLGVLISTLAFRAGTPTARTPVTAASSARSSWRARPM